MVVVGPLLIAAVNGMGNQNNIACGRYTERPYKSSCKINPSRRQTPLPDIQTSGVCLSRGG